MITLEYIAQRLLLEWVFIFLWLLVAWRWHFNKLDASALALLIFALYYGGYLQAGGQLSNSQTIWHSIGMVVGVQIGMAISKIHLRRKARRNLRGNSSADS